jgi:hypothetical protein
VWVARALNRQGGSKKDKLQNDVAIAPFAPTPEPLAMCAHSNFLAAGSQPKTIVLR